MYAHLHICMYAQERQDEAKDACVCMRERMCVYVYIVHMYIYTYIHICTGAPKRGKGRGKKGDSNKDKDKEKGLALVPMDHLGGFFLGDADFVMAGDFVLHKETPAQVLEVLQLRSAHQVKLRLLQVESVCVRARECGYVCVCVCAREGV